MWYGEYKRLGFFLLVSTFYILSWTRTKAVMPFQIDSQGQAPNDWVAQLLVEADKVKSGHIDVDEDIYRSLGTFGSRPPNCERKCGRCSPCTAIQVPAFTNHFGTQYSNYEPEDWKCRCGSTVYNP